MGSSLIVFSAITPISRRMGGIERVIAYPFPPILAILPLPFPDPEIEQMYAQTAYKHLVDYIANHLLIGNIVAAEGTEIKLFHTAFSLILAEK